MAFLCLLGLVSIPANAHFSDGDDDDLFNKPLQDLMQMQVTIAKGTPESLADTSAAVSVITQDDIQRSGATSIAEALRTVPGMDVARLDSHTWAVSARGFNDVFADKLLVLIDGRTVYTPLFSGVFWDVQDTLLEDIDHIEVVRGPGATLWGANAVNGVINIITKSAANTEGVLVSGGGGTQEGDFANVRYGASLAPGIFLRGYARYFDRDDSNLPKGSPADDAWSMFRGGFRFDIDRTNQNTLTIQGDGYTGNEHEIYMVAPAPLASVDNVSGENLSGRWQHAFSEDSNLKVQLDMDRTVRDAVVFGEERNTFDLNAQHNFDIGERNEVVWGLEYRFSDAVLRNTPYLTFTDPYRSLNWYTAFLQDDVALVHTNLHLIVGSKFEDNDFTGFEVQPSARLLWTPGGRQTVWGSVSRAVRTPSEAETEVVLNTAGIPAVGNPRMLSEELLAYELGYRIQPLDRLSLEATAYYNHYDRLRSENLMITGTGPELEAGNTIGAHGYGGELSGSWQVSHPWRLQTGLSYSEINTTGSDQIHTEDLLAWSNPRYQAFLRSSLDILTNVSLDGTLRYVDTISFPASGLPGVDTRIPSYVTFDARLSWRVTKNVEVSIVGQNLAQSQHLEFAPTTIPTEQTAVLRSVYGKVTLRF